MISKEKFDNQSDALNQIASIVHNTPGLAYLITSDMLDADVPENANLEFGINSSSEIAIYRKDI